MEKQSKYSNNHQSIQTGDVEGIIVNIGGKQIFYGPVSIEILQAVYKNEAESIKQYLLTILKSPDHPWKNYRDLRRRYIDIEGEVNFSRQDDFDFPLVPTALQWLDEQNANIESESVDSIIKILKQHQRIVLLGDPGAGKSTTLQVMLIEAAAACLKNSENNPLPIYLRLGTWPKDVKTLRNWVQRYLQDWSIQNQPIHRVLLLLDGLNEMEVYEREERIQSIQIFLEEYDSAHILLTCRESDYKINQWDKKIHLKPIIARPLDDTRIKSFLLSYIQNREDAVQLWKKINRIRQLDDRKSLLELVRNPYLLSILVLIYNWSGKLPDGLADLFLQMVKVRWMHETKQRVGKPEDYKINNLSFDEFIRELANLAFTMIDNEKNISIEIEWIYKELKFPFRLGPVCIYRTNKKHISNILLVGKACSLLIQESNEIRFCHQLVQEYFAALALNWHTIPVTSTESLWKWGGVLSARACMGEKAQNEIIGILMNIFEEDTSAVSLLRFFYAASWMMMGSDIESEEFGSAVSDAVDDKVENIRQANAAALADIGTQEMQDFIALANGSNGNDQIDAIKALGVIALWHDAPPLLESMTENLVFLLQNEDTSIREAAVGALGNASARLQASPLRICAVNSLITALDDENWNVRRAAQRALENAGEAVVELLTIALTEGNGLTRIEIAKILIQIAAQESDETIGIPAINFLMQARHDEDESVRQAAREFFDEFEQYASTEAALYDAVHRGSLIDVLRDEYEEIYQDCLELLQDCSLKFDNSASCVHTIDRLLSKLEDVPEFSRGYILWTIGVVSKFLDDAGLVVKIVELLIINLHSENVAMREAAAWSLGEISTQINDPMLQSRVIAGLAEKLLDDERIFLTRRVVSYAAIYALWQIGTLEALNALREHGFGNIVDMETL